VSIVHRELAAGRWFELPLVEQMANIALADYFVFDNSYGSTDEAWKRYFHAFTYAAALRKGR